ncbi:MAG: hypothetical protein ACYTFY_12385 [Planctomycetota bacterium]
MPFELTYDKEIDAIICKVCGNMTYDEIPALGEALLTHSDFRTNINQLFDCTEGQLEATADELRKTAKDFLKVADVLGLKRKLALAVSRDVDFGMMRMYEVHFQPDPGVQIRSFRSLDEARAWLVESS